MRVVFQAESDLWCRGILAQHWPDVPCYEDVRAISGGDRLRDGRRDSATAEGGEQQAPTVDLLCGGSPCQDLSVAGARAGLAGARSGLFFEFARIADELVRPGGWLIFENVPGLLSSAGGRDFAVVLRTLGDIGFHDLAWRVLDSRYFGVPQRRRRVFIVGRRAAGDGAREVLLESESGGGNFAPSREKRAGVAGSVADGAQSSRALTRGGNRCLDGDTEDFVVANTLKGHNGRGGSGISPEDTFIAGTVRSHMRPGSNDSGGIVAPALVKRYAKGTDSDATDCLIAHTLTDSAEPSADSAERCAPPDPDGMRATPELPGWLDGSEIDPRPDGPRYSAMGNAVTVNVLEWIGRRILDYERAREPIGAA